MKYNKYTNLILEEIKDEIDINSRVKKLKKIKDQINKTKADIESIINKSIKNLLRCPKCGKYINPQSVESKYKNKTELGVCIYSDCGYGDDDEYADITYQIIYKKCPFCNNDIETSRYKISESNRRNKYGS